LTHSNNTNLYYDVIAEYYPYFYRDWETQFEREGLSLRAIFRNQGVERVLDASCGIGVQAVPLAQLGYQVVAADPSAGMLRKAHEMAAKFNVEENIHFERADFLTLPDYVHLSEQAGFTDLRAADWSDAVAPFWDAVIGSVFEGEALTGLLQTGLPTMQGAIALGLMRWGFQRGLIRYGILTATKSD